MAAFMSDARTAVVAETEPRGGNDVDLCNRLHSGRAHGMINEIEAVREMCRRIARQRSREGAAAPFESHGVAPGDPDRIDANGHAAVVDKADDAQDAVATGRFAEHDGGPRHEERHDDAASGERSLRVGGTG